MKYASASPVRHRRRIRRAGSAVVAAAAIALTMLLAAPAQADPGTEAVTEAVVDAASALLGQNLPLPGASTGSADLPSLLRSLAEPPSADDSPPGDPGSPTARRTSCRTVVHIGDSTSVGIDDASRIPDGADRLTAQYQRVGVRSVTLNALGGRSIVEKVNGEPNAVDAIDAELAAGHRGCWVIAMGVNDAANIAVGSAVDADQRIDRVMSRLGGRQVLWPTVMTGAPDDPAYAPANMRTFNAALGRAAARYPTLRVYDFAAHARPGWFADGIHYTETGLVQRNRMFATALAAAFPQ